MMVYISPPPPPRRITSGVKTVGKTFDVHSDSLGVRGQQILDTYFNGVKINQGEQLAHRTFFVGVLMRHVH